MLKAYCDYFKQYVCGIASRQAKLLRLLCGAKKGLHLYVRLQCYARQSQLSIPDISLCSPSLKGACKGIENAPGSSLQASQDFSEGKVARKRQGRYVCQDGGHIELQGVGMMFWFSTLVLTSGQAKAKLEELIEVRI